MGFVHYFGTERFFSYYRIATSDQCHAGCVPCGMFTDFSLCQNDTLSLPSLRWTLYDFARLVIGNIAPLVARVRLHFVRRC